VYVLEAMYSITIPLAIVCNVSPCHLAVTYSQPLALDLSFYAILGLMGAASSVDAAALAVKAAFEDGHVLEGLSGTHLVVMLD
jgi:hypothetical protein